MYLLNHKHEIVSKQTSSFSYNYLVYNDIKWVFIEAPGNDKYIKTRNKIINAFSTSINLCIFIENNNTWQWKDTYINYLNKWTHVTYTCSQVSPYLVQMYINGNLVKYQNGRGSFVNIPNIFIIGRSGDQGRAYNGYIRHFFAFNSILNSSDIKNIYNSTA
jgi:hypothetical protein